MLMELKLQLLYITDWHVRLGFHIQLLLVFPLSHTSSAALVPHSEHIADILQLVSGTSKCLFADILLSRSQNLSSSTWGIRQWLQLQMYKVLFSRPDIGHHNTTRLLNRTPTKHLALWNIRKRKAVTRKLYKQGAKVTGCDRDESRQLVTFCLCYHRWVHMSLAVHIIFDSETFACTIS